MLPVNCSVRFNASHRSRWGERWGKYKSEINYP